MYRMVLFPMALSDTEWFSKIFNDTKHRAVYLRQLSLSYKMALRCWGPAILSRYNFSWRAQKSASRTLGHSEQSPWLQEGVNSYQVTASQGSKPSWPEQAFKHHTRPDRLSTHPDLPSSLFRLQWGSVWPNLTMPSMTFQCHYFLNAANVTDYTGNHRILLFSVGEICVACTLIAAAAAEFICHEKNIHVYINVKDRRAARKE